MSARRSTAAGASGHRGVGSWIARRARLTPDHVALVYGDTHRTYAGLAARVRRLAQGLRTLGVERGDLVGWIGPNHPAFLEALFATATLGAAMAPINHRLEPETIRGILDELTPAVLFVDRALIDLPLPAIRTRVIVGDPDDIGSEYEQLLAGQTDAPIDLAVSLDELCLMPFTSGTTGAPKGVMLSHANVTWNAINALTALDLRREDVTVAVAPFFRTGGTGVTVLPVLFAGGTVVIPRRGDADDILQLIESRRVTVAFGNPDLIDALTQAPRWTTADLTSLRGFVTGGSMVSERLLRVGQERGLPLLQGYGLSEAGPFVSVLDARHANKKAGSAGKPALFLDVRIVTRDGSDAAAGTIGELLVRGPNVSTGYWNRPDATARTFDANGWLHTGDAARLDADGFLFVIGRVADAYLSHGELVYPAIVEHVLLQHASVAEASVVGGDNKAVAYVVLEPGAGPTVKQELFAVCREQLPVHARPDEIAFVASLPKNPAGKILRRLLRCEVVPAAALP